MNIGGIMIKIIFIHGNGGGSVDDGWYPYLKTQFQKAGLEVVSKNFPDRDLARASIWLPFLENELLADHESILIGHSSGAEAAMRYAENHQILGSVLVSPCYTDLGDPKEKQSGYYDKPWDWETIKKNQEWIVQFSSTDDPYIPIAEARYVHEKLGTEYYEFQDRGHFIDQPEFPEIVKVTTEKLNV